MVALIVKNIWKKKKAESKNVALVIRGNRFFLRAAACFSIRIGAGKSAEFGCKTYVLRPLEVLAFDCLPGF
jgi:hypothetical protein